LLEVLTEQSRVVHENGRGKRRKKGRSIAEKMGWYRYKDLEFAQMKAALVDIRRILVRVEDKITRAHRYDLGLEPEELLEVATKDNGADLAILEVLREAGVEGKLPKDIWQDVRRHGLKYHHITRRIKRMNRRLQARAHENVAEKVGARWHLSDYMRDNWLSKVDEVERETLTEKV
jgi:hypothetical protein